MADNNTDNWMISDLHIHSRFSRACSKEITLDNLAKWGKIKGLDLLGTGDFTHPKWFEEIKAELKENEKGFYIHKKTGFLFVLSGEISLIYSQGGKSRKVHLVLLIPSIEIAEKIHKYLDDNGLRRDYDGRPIFGISCENFTKEMKNISDDIEIIPAHIWTPYFGVFGSMSGFDSLAEAFGPQVNNIYSIETGISSDPEMNWKIKELVDRNICILSFSDSHSFWPWRLGREATIFKRTDSYKELIRQIRENDILSTIETDPRYGKYHWDGHSVCNFSCSPEETEKLNGICPKCKSKLVIGVENRVNNLAFKNKIEIKNKKPFFTILPLHEIIALYFSCGINTKKVWDIYNKLIQEFKTEFNILLHISKEELNNFGLDNQLIELILKNRNGEIKVKPGYDGEYGKALIGNMKIEKQSKLF